jgi:hypothetical protein
MPGGRISWSPVVVCAFGVAVRDGGDGDSSKKLEGRRVLLMPLLDDEEMPGGGVVFNSWCVVGAVEDDDDVARIFMLSKTECMRVPNVFIIKRSETTPRINFLVFSVSDPKDSEEGLRFCSRLGG